MRSLPNSIALLTTHKPFPFINFSSSNPMKHPLSMWFIIKKLSLIKIKILILFKSHPLSLIKLPLSFINPARIPNQNSQSLSLSILQLSFKKCILIPFNSKILHRLELIKIKKITDHICSIISRRVCLLADWGFLRVFFFWWLSLGLFLFFEVVTFGTMFLEIGFLFGIFFHCVVLNGSPVLLKCMVFVARSC